MKIMPYIPPSVVQEVKRMDSLWTIWIGTLFWKHLHHRNTRHLENIEWKMEVADGGNLFFFLFALILLFVLISVMFWVFLLIGRYENSIQEHLKNALLLAVGRLPRTLLMWIVWGLPVAIVIFYPIWMVAFGWFFITIGVAVLLWMSWLVQRGAVAWGTWWKIRLVFRYGYVV